MMSMTRLWAVLFFVVMATVAPARGQVPDSLDILWRVQLGGLDYMSTVSSFERSFFPSEGQIFYLYTQQVPGTRKVHRLYGAGDHMDSLWSEGRAARWYVHPKTDES